MEIRIRSLDENKNDWIDFGALFLGATLCFADGATGGTSNVS
jgi:hypothetical protein